MLAEPAPGARPPPPRPPTPDAAAASHSMTRSGTLEISLANSVRGAQGGARSPEDSERAGEQGDGRERETSFVGDGRRGAPGPLEQEGTAATARPPSRSSALHRASGVPSTAPRPALTSSSTTSKPLLSTSSSSARLRAFLRPSPSSASLHASTIAPAMQKSASADAAQPRARVRTPGLAPAARPQSMLWGSGPFSLSSTARQEEGRTSTAAGDGAAAAAAAATGLSVSPTRWRRPLLPRAAASSPPSSSSAGESRRHGRSHSLGSVLTLARGRVPGGGARAGPSIDELAVPAQAPPQPAPPKGVRKKTSLAAMKEFLSVSSSRPGVESGAAGGAAGTVTDEELAAWREAGKERRAASRSAGNWADMWGARGEEELGADDEDEVLIIGLGAVKDGARAGSSSATSSSTRLPYDMNAPPFSSLLPSPAHSPRPASPPSSSRRSSSAHSHALSASRRASDTSFFPSTSRRQSDCPAPSVAACPPRAPAAQVDRGPLNVLEFVAVDAGGDGDEALPLHFPQAHGGELGGFSPSAISGFPPPPRPALERTSSGSSRFSLGSEEGMVLSVLAAADDGDGGDGGLLFPPSPAMGGSSPVLGSRPLLADKPAPESSLPPSMQHLFATPAAPRPASRAGAPLSVPSRRAAPPAPIAVRPAPSPSLSSRRRSAGVEGQGLGLSGTPPPRPPRSPSRAYSTPVSPASPSAWSPLGPTRDPASRPSDAALDEPSPTAPHRPRRSVERARAAAAAALEGRPPSASGTANAEGDGEGSRAQAWTPPPTPPRSDKVR
ncbi:hypothetical protein JCM3775_003201 [Rhodotorula graminis]